MQDDVLEVMITEYKVLRGELYKIYEYQLRTLAVVVSALGIVYGIIFTDYNTLSILFLIIPIIILPFGLKFQYSSRGAVILSEYLKKLESQIKEKKNIADWKGWTGFQYFYMKEKRKLSNDIIFDAIPKFLIFIAIPMWIAFWYTLNDTINDKYDWLGWVYLISSIVIFLFFCNSWYKEFKEIKNKEHEEKEETGKEEKKNEK